MNAWGPWLALLGPAGAAMPCLADVHVVLDLDPTTPGFQSTLAVQPSATAVNGVAVYVVDTAGPNSIWGIGYLGGIDRGIALGHMPDNANHGTVAGFSGHVGAPIVAGNFALVYESPGLDPGFIGPEVQYVEGGVERPGTIPATAGTPLFTVDITLSDTQAGDVFDLYLLDMVVVWSGGQGGAFSTQGPLTLDSGGDAVPDGTLTIYGLDPDTPLPAPPAAFAVDYIDGPAGGGPATIRVVPLGDLDGDGIVGIVDFLNLLAAWGPCAGCPPSCAADLDGDCAVGINDLLLLLANWT